MPKVDHKSKVLEAWNQAKLPSPPRTVESILSFTNLVLMKIPIEEKVGYVKSPPGGHNSVVLPDGVKVRVGRLMYADGYMYKFMNDVPNGGPQWVLEETGENPLLYHPYINSDTEPNKPDENEDLKEKIRILENHVHKMANDLLSFKIDIDNHKKRMEAINTRFDMESSNLNVHKPLPDYIGEVSIFGLKRHVISTPIKK